VKRLALGLVCLLLTSCGGSVSYTCDKQGVCLEIWTHTTASSSVTMAQLRTPSGNPVVGTTTSAIGAGWISEIDPFAQGLNTTAQEAKDVQGW
jgi:hypothetical protein